MSSEQEHGDFVTLLNHVFILEVNDMNLEFEFDETLSFWFKDSLMHKMINRTVVKSHFFNYTSYGPKNVA